MRDYLYIWNDPDSRYIVASGIEFGDLADWLASQAGLILLEHNGDSFADDRVGKCGYVPAADIADLAKQNHQGDFAWADCAYNDNPTLSDDEIAQLLFFAHMLRPLRGIALPSLGNKYLCYIHDDGWYLKLHYSSWPDVAALISALYPQLDLAELQTGNSAYWLSGESVETEELTFDIDAILNRRASRAVGKLHSWHQH